MVSNPHAGRSSYASPWLLVVILALLSIGAWWLIAPGAPPATPVRPPGVYVPVYDPVFGRAVAHWRVDWPAGVPVPSTRAVMTQALADAVAAEPVEVHASVPEPLPVEDEARPLPQALPLPTLRRACVEATRRGTDSERACDRFAEAGRHALPAPVVRAGSPPESMTSADHPRSVARGGLVGEEESTVRLLLDGDTCNSSPRGSIAWRSCRNRYKEYLDTECRQRTQAMDAIGVSPTPWQILQTRGYCGAASRYQPLDG